jgi:hypothetical protein
VELATQELEDMEGAGRRCPGLPPSRSPSLGEPRFQDAQSNVASAFTRRLDGYALSHI